MRAKILKFTIKRFTIYDLITIIKLLNYANQ